MKWEVIYIVEVIDVINLYDSIMKPLENIKLSQIRRNLISNAFGRVLEMGAGTGVNFKYYDLSKIYKVSIIDRKISDILKERVPKGSETIEGDVSNLPFCDKYFDTVIGTLLFCSVDQPEKAFSEVYRVLKPEGKFLLLEHVLSDVPKYAKMQNKLNIVWPKIADGCNLNRETEKILNECGFKFDKKGSFAKGIFIWGIATKI